MAMTRLPGLTRCWSRAVPTLCALALSLFMAAVAAGDAAANPDAALAQKIDVDFWRDYPEEVLAILEIKTGLKSIYPSTLERSFSFSLQEKDLPVKALLEKFAAAGHLDMETRAGLLFFWQKADDKNLKELTEKLQSADRWARCEAAWELGNLADPRIYPLLFQAAGDPDRGVVRWVLLSLGKHSSVLPYVEAAGKDVVTKAAQAALATDRNAFWSPHHQLLGALNTPASVDILLAKLQTDDDAARANAVRGLGYSKDPRAVDALLKLADEAAAAKYPPIRPMRGVGAAPRIAQLLFQLPDALARIGDARGVDALKRMIDAEGFPPHFKGQCLGALSRIRSAKAVEIVVKAVAGGGTMDGNPYFWLDASDSRIADALAAHVLDDNQQFRETAISTLARARDPRAIGPLLHSIQGNKQPWFGKPEQLAAIRDSRAEQAILDLIKDDKEGDQWGMRNWGSALMATRDPKVVEVAFELMKDVQNNMEVRGYAAKALVRGLTDQRLAGELVAYLKTAEQPLLQAAVLDTQRFGNMAESPVSREPGWVELLVTLGRGQDRKVGDEAIRMLGMCRNPYAQQAVLREIANPDAKVRLAAVRSCAGMAMFGVRQDDPVLADALAPRLTDDDPALRRSAAIALGQLGDPRALEPLLEAARTEKGAMDAFTIWSLLGSFDDPKAAETLIQLAKDPNTQQRESLLHLLDPSKNPKIAAALLELATDKDLPLGVRTAALLRLQRSGTKDRKVADLLWDLLKDPKLDWNNRMYVVGALEQSDDPALGESFLAFVRNKDIPQEARENVIGHMSASGLQKEAKEKFVTLLGDQDLPASIRAKVAVMLSGAPVHRGRTVAKPGETDPRLLDAMLALYKSKELSESARKSVIDGLLYSGEQKALQAVCDSLAGADLKTKFSIGSSLCQILKDERAIEPLLDVLKEGDFQDRRSAAYSLGTFRDAKNVKTETRQKIKAALDEYEKTKDTPVRPPPPPPGEF